jgi:hypothetical protein
VREFAAACAVFDTLRNKNLGARDRGLPAARACLMKGDGDAAIGWLKTIPAQYLPAEIETDPAFAALKGRPDFHALFAARLSAIHYVEHKSRTPVVAAIRMRWRVQPAAGGISVEVLLSRSANSSIRAGLSAPNSTYSSCDRNARA